MDNLEEIAVKSDSFVKHVFNFDDNTKSDLIGIAQYSLLAIIPIILLNKSMQRFIPEVDEEKGSLEILMEVTVQLLIIFFGMYYIHRVITYLPSYGGKQYGQLNMFNFILAFLVIVMSLQTKLGEKVNILFERGLELWFGPQQISEEPQKKNIVRVSQPISGSGGGGGQQQQQMGSTSSQLHQADQVANYNTMMAQQQQQPQQPSIQQRDTIQPSYEQTIGQRGGGGASGGMTNTPNFDSMYQEPMAANEAFGGMGAYSSY